MSAAGRRQRLLERLRQLEGEFESLLVRELEQCANGMWGVLRQNPTLLPHVRKLLEPLDALEHEITELQDQLHEPPFPPLRRYRAYCAMRGPNTPGEPTLAKQLLAELRH